MAATITEVANLKSLMERGTPPYTAFEAVNLGADFTPTIMPQTRGVFVGTAGNLKIDSAHGELGVLVPVVAGENKIAAMKIYSTANGTTAANVVAAY